MHTHTHPFNGALSGTTRVSQYQKDFTEARDSEWQWHQQGRMKSAPRTRQITTPVPHYSVFYRPDALPAAQPTVSKHWRQFTLVCKYFHSWTLGSSLASCKHFQICGISELLLFITLFQANEDSVFYYFCNCGFILLWTLTLASISVVISCIFVSLVSGPWGPKQAFEDFCLGIF